MSTVPALHHYHLAAQFITQQSFKATRKPYEMRTAVHQHLGMYLETAPLEHENHHRVTLSATVEGKDEAGVTVVHAQATVEAVVVVSASLEEDEVARTLRADVCAALCGTLRTTLTTLHQGTGFPAMVLPPLSVQQLSQLPPPPQVP